MTLIAQENALPFPAGTFTPEQIATAMRLDVRDDRAVFLQPEQDGLSLSFYQLLAGQWEWTDTPAVHRNRPEAYFSTFDGKVKECR